MTIDNVAACTRILLKKILFIHTTENKTKLLPVWKTSLITILFTRAKIIHWNWEQNTCITKRMCTRADCN